MSEAKIGIPPSERKSKPTIRQITGRILSAVALMSTMGIIPGDYSLVDTGSVNNFQGELLTSPEAGQGPYCLFISGGFGTTAGVRGIKEGLEKQYGAGKVDVFNSVLNFEDPQNPKRFEQMADMIQTYSRNGLDIVAHSLGAAELRKALRIVEKRDPSFFDDKKNTGKLNIYLIAPSGFNEGIKGRIDYLGRSWRFLHEQADLPVVSVQNSIFRGLDAQAAFPPVGISPEVFTDALRKALPELSQLKENSEIQTISLKEERDYSDKLTVEQKQDVADYSEMMRRVIESENYDGLRSLVLKYGEKLREPLKMAYAGAFESEPVQVQEAVKATIGGYLGMISTFIDGFGSEPMKELAKLHKKGVNINFLIPEYDFMMPLDQSVKFFGTFKDAEDHTLIVLGMPHSFPALHKYGFGEAVKNFQGDGGR